MKVTEEQMLAIYSIAFEHEGCIGGSEPKFSQEGDLVIMEEKFTCYGMEPRRSFYPEEYRIDVCKIKPDGNYEYESQSEPMEADIQIEWEKEHAKSEPGRQRMLKMITEAEIIYDAEGNETHKYSDGNDFTFMISDEQKKQRKKMCQDMMEAAKRDADLKKNEESGSGAKA